MEKEINRGRKKKEIDGEFAKILSKLLREAKENGIGQDSIARAIGVSRQSLGKWANGATVPDVLDLKKLANYFNVSADYLLGLSPNSTTDMELIDVCNYTGLSESNVKFLNKLNELKKVHKKYFSTFENSKEQYTEIEYIDIISVLLEYLNEDRSIVVDIAHAAMLNENSEDDLLLKLLNLVQDNFPELNNSDFTILSGYGYKKFYTQKIQSKLDYLTTTIIHKLSPKEFISPKYDISDFITFTSTFSLEKMADVHIKSLLAHLEPENKEDSDNAQHNPKNE